MVKEYKRALDRYKDPYARMLKVREYNKQHRTSFKFEFRNEKDQEIISELKAANNKTELVRKWHEAYKKNNESL